jgi:hypothetical protein
MVHNGYSDSIIQENSRTITIAVNGSFNFSGGVFIGGNSNIANSGSFTLDSNAKFINTSATFSIRNFVSIDDGDDFTHNNGTISLFSYSSGSETTVDMDTITLYKFKIDNAAGDKKVTFGSDNEITVENDFTLSGSTTTYDIALFSGKIFSKKNVYVQYYKSLDYGQGTTELILDGDSTQIIDGTGNNSGALFKVTINKGTDTLKIINTIHMQNNWTNNGCIMSHSSSSIVVFKYPSTIDGNTEFNRLAFEGLYSYTTWNISDTLNVLDDLTFKGNGVVYLLGGEIHCDGDFDLSPNTALNDGTASSTY